MSEDEYAAKYMKPSGGVILRDKIVGRTLLLIMGIAALVCGSAAVATFLNMFSAADPGAVVAAIEQARGTRLRVAVEAEAQAEPLEEAAESESRSRAAR